MKGKEHVAAILRNLSRGISSKRETFMCLTLAIDQCSIEEIWTAIPVELQSEFKSWIAEYAAKEEVVFGFDERGIDAKRQVQQIQQFLSKIS